MKTDEHPDQQESPERPEPGVFAVDAEELVRREELAGCWRTFGVLALLLIVVFVGWIGYRTVFVVRPWMTAQERAQQEREEERQDLLAGLPDRAPDVIGDSLVDALYRLNQGGYPQILLFTSEEHAVSPQEFTGNAGNPVQRMRPEPGGPPTLTVEVWVGPVPDAPPEYQPIMPEEMWWFPHGELIEERGSYHCLQCHDTAFCTECHEERVLSAHRSLTIEPEEEPGLASAIAGVTETAGDSILAVSRGEDHHQVDILLDDPPAAQEVAVEAREGALKALPAGFGWDDSVQTLVLRWVHSGSLEVLVEIGMERDTFEETDWMSLTAADIPWQADRYMIHTPDAQR